MATVTRKTANWRLFGGTAILAAGVLWILALATNVLWLQGIAQLALAAGLFFVAFGQTGGNGAVGKYLLGKIALVVYAAGWVLIAVNGFLADDLPKFVMMLAALAVILGGLVSAWAIERKAIAKGAAQWILFLPALVGALVVVALVLPALTTLPWMLYVLAILFAVTGALYLFNDRKLG